jgi:hypothetical protein
VADFSFAQQGFVQSAPHVAVSLSGELSAVFVSLLSLLPASSGSSVEVSESSALVARACPGTIRVDRKRSRARRVMRTPSQVESMCEESTGAVNGTGREAERSTV